jgi:hypothetical protein
VLDRDAFDREVGDGMDRHQPLELMLNLLDHHGRAGGDDGDARQMRLVLGLRHGERLDIVAASSEQPDDAREHARLVVDQHAHRMPSMLLLRPADRIGRSGLGHQC